MTRGRHATRAVALIACLSAGLLALPATGGAQSAVDEYTLDIPGGGSGSSSASSGGPPSAGAAGAATGASAAEQRGEAAGAGSATDGRSGGGGDAAGVAVAFAPFHEGVGGAADTIPSARSAPEVITDTLLDGAMLPLLGALVLITGVGAWRVLRHRRTLTGAPG